MSLLAWALATAMGLSLGLLGGGGSILTVPIFTYVLGYPPKQAIAMSLPVVGLAAASGAGLGLVRGTLPLVPALTVGAATMAGAYTGARLSVYLSGATQLAVLAVAMFAAAAAMWQRARRAEALHAGARPHALLLVAVGLGVGLLTGIVGIGGGFMIVPALVIAGGLPMRQATSASLLIIALSAAAGLAGYVGQVEVVWSVVWAFAFVSALGVLAGGLIAGRVPARRLQEGFAVFLLVLAGYILYRGA
ncbi:MAG: sulfite exporter TauE/SafE family protein [Vicinamibacterales bacterium]